MLTHPPVSESAFARRRLRARLVALCSFGFAALLAGIALRAAAASPPTGPPPALHAPFDTLLSRYLVRNRVRYLNWWAADSDRARLTRYIDSLEAQRPSTWREADAKAYWINLYNAATIELVLEHYPINTIKDIGRVIGSPWGRKFLRVEGRSISLDLIENEVLEKRFPDSRLHFALNCASIGCPPLRARTYSADSLDAQLDEAAWRTINDPRHVQVTGRELHISELFKWYKDDFKRDVGSIEAFLARYRSDVVVGAGLAKYSFYYLDYDWALNEAR